MGISSISSISSSQISFNSNDSSKLESEIESIQQQINQENLSKDDEKTKKVKIQELENKLYQLESQLRQGQSQKIENVKVSGNDNSNNLSDKNSDSTIDIFA